MVSIRRETRRTLKRTRRERYDEPSRGVPCAGDRKGVYTATRERRAQRALKESRVLATERTLLITSGNTIPNAGGRCRDGEVAMSRWGKWRCLDRKLYRTTTSPMNNESMVFEEWVRVLIARDYRAGQIVPTCTEGRHIIASNVPCIISGTRMHGLVKSHNDDCWRQSV